MHLRLGQGTHLCHPWRLCSENLCPCVPNVATCSSRLWLVAHGHTHQPSSVTRWLLSVAMQRSQGQVQMEGPELQMVMQQFVFDLPVSAVEYSSLVNV